MRYVIASLILLLGIGCGKQSESGSKDSKADLNVTQKYGSSVEEIISAMESYQGIESLMQIAKDGGQAPNFRKDDEFGVLISAMKATPEVLNNKKFIDDAMAVRQRVLDSLTQEQKMIVIKLGILREIKDFKNKNELTSVQN